MATRKTPDVPNFGASIADSTYALDVDTEVEALWALAPETLGSVAGTNTITAACTPTLLAYNTKTYWITPANSNSGATTLNIDSLGAKNVKTQSGSALTGGELAAGVPTLLYYTGTEFRIGYPQPSTTANALPLNYLSGFTLSNDVGDTNNYIGIAAGAARDSTNAKNLVGSAMVKKLNAAWVAGTSQGGVLQSANLTGTITITTNTSVTGSGTTFSTDFQVGDCITSAGGQSRRITAVSSNTAMTVESAWGLGETGVTYKRGGKPKSSTLRIYALYKDADATVDYACSMRDTPVDLPAGYGEYRRIGYVLTDSSANNRQFVQSGDSFSLLSPVTGDALSGAINIGSGGATQSGTITSIAPPSTFILIRMQPSSASAIAGDRYLAFRQSAQSARSLTGATVTYAQMAYSASMGITTGYSQYADIQILLNSSSQFSFDAYTPNITGGNSNDSVSGALTGWIDRRGRDG